MSHQEKYTCPRRRRICQRTSLRPHQSIEEPMLTLEPSPIEYVMPPQSRRGMEASCYYRCPQATCFPPRQSAAILRNHSPSLSSVSMLRSHTYNLNGFPPLFDPAIVNPPCDMYFFDYFTEPYAYPVNSLGQLPCTNTSATPLSTNLHILISSLLLNALIGLSANPPQEQSEPEVDDGIRVIIRPLVKSVNLRRSGGATPSVEAPSSATRQGIN